MTYLKKITGLMVIIMTLSANLNAQKVYFWIEAGLKAQAGIGQFYNANLFNDRDLNSTIGNTYGIGAKAAFNFGQFHGLIVEGVYQTSGQKHELSKIEAIKFNRDLSMTAIDIYGMYRYNRRRNYVEFGAKYSMIQDVQISINNSDLPPAKDAFQDHNISPAFGFGYYVFNSGGNTANIGFRLHYGLNDILTDKSATNHYFTLPNIPDTYKTTNPAFIEFLFEFNFGLGQYAKSMCSKRASFMSM